MLTPERIQELFDYDPATGNLIWRVGRRGRFARPGVIAGNRKRYVMVSIDCKTYAVHRVIWLLHYGHLPDEIDHVNQDKTDNRLENLRVCSRSENTGNVGLRSTNTSGHRGVWFVEHCGRWRASIKENGKSRHLGYFDTIEDASRAYNKAAIDYFGRFACLNKVQD
jgi:hypothetical protein